MERPFALWALLFALLPWLALLRPPRAEIQRVPFPALSLLASPQARKRRSRRALLRAALRSLALVALAILWAAPKISDDAAPAPSQNAVQTRALTSILVVDGADLELEPSGTAARSLSSAQILTLALSAQLDDAKIERVPAIDFALRPDAFLQGRDALLVAELAALAPQEERAIQRFAQSGGAVVLWSGLATDPARWNETLRRWNVDAEIVQSPLDDAPGVPRSHEERAFLAAFPGAASAKLDALPVARAALVLGDDVVPILRDRKSRAPVFARLADGIYWFALSPDPREGALAAIPAFPALVEATTRYALNAPREPVKFARSRRDTLRRAGYVIALLVVAVAALVELAPFRPRPTRRRR